MNIKEGFRYKNFLSYIIHEISNQLVLQQTHKTVSENHLISKANPEAEDIIKNPYEFTEVYDFHHLLGLSDVVIYQLGELSDSIYGAKTTDTDKLIEGNKYRRIIASSIKKALDSKPSKTEKSERATKFDVEGNQVSYIYGVEVTSKDSFDRDVVTRKHKDMLKKSDEISTDVDKFLVTQEIDFVPTFEVNSSFDEVYSQFVESIEAFIKA